MKLVLPYPPSANRYWRVFRGIVTKSEEARAFQLGNVVNVATGAIVRAATERDVERFAIAEGGVLVVKGQTCRLAGGVRDLVRAQLGPRARFPAFAGPVTFCMVVFRPAQRGDLDNCLKVVLDALKGIAFADDSQVKRIVADQDDSPSNPRAEVLIEPRRLAGQQTALELGEAENPAAWPPPSSLHELGTTKVPAPPLRLCPHGRPPGRPCPHCMRLRASPNVVRSSPTAAPTDGE